MQAIILAAGMGKRLGQFTKENTKTMVKVNGVALIDRLLFQLSKLDLNRIIIVIGYEGEKLKDYINSNYTHLNIAYIENSVYDKTNNIYSLWLAKRLFADDDTILLESDLILDDSIFQLVYNSKCSNLALVDKYQSWMDGTMVQLDQNNRIANFIPKRAFRYDEVDSYYKTVNVYKFSKLFINNTYIPFLDAYIKTLGNNEYYEQVLRVITLLDKCELKALPLNGEKWYEIDDIQDLDIAETLFAESDLSLPLFQKRYGGYWRFPKMLDFCYLVNPFFPPKRLISEMKANFEILLSQYPSGLSVNNLLAGKYFGLDQKYICVGNGAAELIKILMENLPGKLGIIFPTFEEYPNTRKADNVLEYCPANDEFSYSAEDLINYYNDEDISSLLIINPDNPSGNFISKDNLLLLINWAKKKGILLIIDESFVDFSEQGEQNSLLDDNILSLYNNLIVIKSISKSYGVPGLRLGVLATSNEEILQLIRKNVSIWNINSFGEFYMQIFNKYEQDYKIACCKFREERDRFFLKLKQVSFLRVIPSQANYFLCEINDRFTAAELTNILLTKHNILIKDCSKKKIFNNRNYIRIAVRDNIDNDFLIDVLNRI